MARSEATHVARLLGLIEPTVEGLPSYTHKNYQLSYPVYYDLEDKGHHRAVPGGDGRHHRRFL